MKFVLFHGAFGSPESNWFPQLKEKLEALGQEVIVPQFPVDSWDEVTKAGDKILLKNQSLNHWLKAFEISVLPKIKQRERLCFVGHSLGPLFILHVLEKYQIVLDSTIFVAPFLRKLDCLWQIDHANQSFWKTDFQFHELNKYTGTSYVIYSDNDPYVDSKFSIEFGNGTDSAFIEVKHAGHMNSEAGFVDFPLVYELCKTRIGKEILA